jgi:large subunit ribosomal protein L23
MLNQTKLKSFPIHDLFSFIKYPLVTEKAVTLYENRQYTFIVDRSLRKEQIQYIIEEIFQVKIEKVNTVLLPVKTRRVGKFRGNKTCYKKAYVQLKKGEVISALLN